jgi:hypothetical protein
VNSDLSQRSRSYFEALGTPPANRDPRPFGGKLMRNGETEAARCRSNKSNPPANA